jgi:hypothetical protein
VVPYFPASLELPSNRTAARIVRWRVVIYVLLLLAAIAIASSESRFAGHRPAPPNVESDD